MLILTTKPPRFVLLLVVFLIWTPKAYAWSWPVQGSVLRPFSYDESHPYASGQHRGIDIGADAAGEGVVAPAAGTVSFAGTVPTNGKCVTIETADGYSVTLTHLGSILVAKGATVAERDTVGTVGPSGTAELDEPYVHLGIRVTADANGYVDPLGLLPPAATGDPTEGNPPPSQPISSGGSSAPPAQKPAPASRPASHARGSTVSSGRSRVSHHESTRVQEPRTEVRTRPATQRPAVRAGKPGARASRPAETRTRHLTEPESSSRRPVVEPAAPDGLAGLGAGHEIRSSGPVAQPSRRTPTELLPLLLNGSAALVAVGAALTAARTRRRRLSGTSAVATAQVLHLTPPWVEHGPVSRAA